MHLKNRQNFKGGMTNEYSIGSTTLKQRIEAMPEDCILFRSDFPEYHTEFVGSILAELTNEGTLFLGLEYIPSQEKVDSVLYFLLSIRSYKQLQPEITQKCYHQV